ncbi:hypothetical protein Plhal304r1_c053g0137521 [Plasmopara halstedii]
MSMNLTTVDIKCHELHGLIEKCEPQDVFNFNLFFRMLPSRSFATSKIRGTKKDKARITVGLCFKMTGAMKMEPSLYKAARTLVFFNE